MAASNGQLKYNPFDDIEAGFGCADAALAPVPVVNMNKARRLGWTGFVDTRESVFKMYQEMVELGMLPRLKVDEARPLV